MFVEQLAPVTAALFTGAALYVSVVEQPARLGLDDAALLTEWKPSYKLGARLQAPLALVGGALGLAAWWFGHDWRWAVGAGLLLANWPYTLIAIKPTNDRLQAMDVGAAGGQSRALIAKWGVLHAGRTALGAASTLAFLWAGAERVLIS